MDEWISMKEAAKRLKVSYAKLLQLADRKEVETKDSPLDRRVRLVNVNEVRQIFGLKN